jgi:thiamine-phosphate diphosphorylase / hydroxyethylthiazole kinase
MKREEDVVISQTSNMVDYSLYLVTDSSPGILGDKNLEKTVEAAIKGGMS